MFDEVKCLRAIQRGIDRHHERCGDDVIEIALSPWDWERLDWPDYLGIPIIADPKVQPGRLQIVCDTLHAKMEKLAELYDQYDEAKQEMVDAEKRLDDRITDLAAKIRVWRNLDPEARREMGPELAEEARELSGQTLSDDQLARLLGVSRQQIWALWPEWAATKNAGRREDEGPVPLSTAYLKSMAQRKPWLEPAARTERARVGVRARLARRTGQALGKVAAGLRRVGQALGRSARTEPARCACCGRPTGKS